MLIAFTKIAQDAVQDADLELFLASDDPGQPCPDRPMDHYAWFRGIVRDGSALALGLSLTECAELYLRLHEDVGVRTWAETLSARLSPVENAILASTEP